MQVSQTTNKPTGMRAHCSSPTFSQSTLEDLDRNQGESKLTFWAAQLQLGPPRDANNCHIGKMWMCGAAMRDDS